MTPKDRQIQLCNDKQPHSAMAGLVKWLHLDDKSAIKKKLAVEGRNTQKRLSTKNGEIGLGNPYTRSDSRRFKLLDSLHRKQKTIDEIIKHANKKRNAVIKRGRRKGNVNLTQGLGPLTNAMSMYTHSMKHTFASYETELVTTSWKVFNRDRSSGQICRAYIDAGDLVENLDYDFKLRIKNQTNTTLHLVGVDFRSRVIERPPNLTKEEIFDFNESHPVKIRIDHSQHKPAALTPVEEKKQQQKEHPNYIVLHPNTIKQISIIVTATRPCESFEMIQLQAINPNVSIEDTTTTTTTNDNINNNTNTLKRRGTQFFNTRKRTAGLDDDILSLSHGKGTGTNSRPQSRGDLNHRHHKDVPISPIAAKTKTISPEIINKRNKMNTAASRGKKITVHCPLYLRCPTPHDFYKQVTRMQQTLHQRMSLPSIAFDDNGNMDQTYDQYDDDVGPFNNHLYDEKDDSNFPMPTNSRSRVSPLTGFLGDNPQAKAARQRAREMREKLSKTDYMRELEQKTKDCWDSTFQFQEDRSAMYRLARKNAAAKAKQVLLAATRGGKDNILTIPKLDYNLRMLAPTPKMEWKRRTSDNDVMSNIGKERLDNNTRGRSMSSSSLLSRSGETTLGGKTKSKGSPQRPPPFMVAVKTFNHCDLRNPMDLFNVLHGKGNVKNQKRRRLKSENNNNKMSLRSSASLPIL